MPVDNWWRFVALNMMPGVVDLETESKSNHVYKSATPKTSSFVPS